MKRLKYTVKTNLKEETNNSLTTILEELNISEEEYIRSLMLKDIEKRESRFVDSCR